MPPLHNPRMAPDENAMKAGIALMVENCVQMLSPRNTLYKKIPRIRALGFFILVLRIKLL